MLSGSGGRALRRQRLRHEPGIRTLELLGSIALRWPLRWVSPLFVSCSSSFSYWASLPRAASQRHFETFHAGNLSGGRHQTLSGFFRRFLPATVSCGKLWLRPVLPTDAEIQ